MKIVKELVAVTVIFLKMYEDYVCPCLIQRKQVAITTGITKYPMLSHAIAHIVTTLDILRTDEVLNAHAIMSWSIFRQVLCGIERD